MLHTLYVGADNSTKVVNIKAIKQFLVRYEKPYTILMGDGWDGVQRESCAVIHILNDDTHEDICFVARQLARELEQNSILVTSGLVISSSVEGIEE